MSRKPAAASLASGSSRLLERLRRHAAERPDAVAYRRAGGGPSLTWQGLARGVGSLADTLRHDLPAGATVILSSANRVEYAVAFLAILAAGGTVFPVSAEVADAELRRAAGESGAAGVIGNGRAVAVFTNALPFVMAVETIASDGLLGGDRPRHPERSEGSLSLSRSEEILRCAQDDEDCTRDDEHRTRDDGCRARHDEPAGPGSLLLQSSGTTGLPRIVRRSGRSLDAEALAVAESVGFGPADRVLMTVPLTHSYGLEHGLLAPVWGGSEVVLCRGLDPAVVLPELTSGGVTIFPGVPSTFEILGAAGPPAPLPGLRRAYSAGGPLPRPVFDAFAARFGVRVTQLYGASEIGSVTFNPPDDPPGPGGGFEPDSVGLPMRDVSVRILGTDEPGEPLPPGVEGQVAIRAASMFDGYLEGPAALADGHFPTGDLGRLDACGRLFLTGRLKLLIDVGGLKVNPLEVEAVLSAHPAVAACVVVPIRQSQTVYRLKAIVVPREPGSAVPVEELRALARAGLSPYKVPRAFEVRDALPRSATGKILRHLVEKEQT